MLLLLKDLNAASIDSTTTPNIIAFEKLVRQHPSVGQTDTGRADWQHQTSVTPISWGLGRHGTPH